MRVIGTDLGKKSLKLQPGKNSLSFSVTSSFAGKATCNAHVYYWNYNVPVVISDIDGTITKYHLGFCAECNVLDLMLWDIFIQ